MQAPSIDSLLDCSDEVSLTLVHFVVVVIMKLAKKYAFYIPMPCVAAI